MAHSATGRGCGKLYIVGEYAVMDPRGLAIIAGVDRFVDAFARPSLNDAVGTIYSSYYPASGVEYQVESDGVGGDCVIKHDDDIVGCAVELAFAVVQARGGQVAALDIAIESGLDDAETGKKYGLGSSGAVSVAVIMAITKACDVQLSSLELYKAAYIATAAAGAKGSAGDIACSSHGAVVLYRRPDAAAVQALIDKDAVAAIDAPWPGLIVQCRGDIGGLDLLVGWTGSPVKTDAQLAAAGAARHDQFVSDSADVAADMWQAMQDSAVEVGAAEAGAAHTGAVQAVLAGIRRARALLAAYAQATGLIIETPLLAALADSADTAHSAGKSSGAGGGDCGIAVVDTSAPITVRDTILRAWRSAGIEPLRLGIAPVVGESVAK